ncbi:thyroid hormone receptor interactor 13, variant 2 [Capsaspora owczarzaki ATCC 30864]|nr:thyroid hormone receptor interactor 13, variant 2 [Capsaspora owczarzaki ATCC 30864]
MLHLYQMSDADTSGAIDMDQAPGSNHEHPPSFHADTTGFDGDQAAMNGAQPTSGEETAQEDASCMEYAIPNREFHGIWESLVFDQNGQVQSRLLQYATTAMLFSEYNVNSNVVSWNRVILLHGPPGSGKTSLCKVEEYFIRFVRCPIDLTCIPTSSFPPTPSSPKQALAQKLAIRLSGRHFAQGRFIEINSHNLFSKYFSESGKLVGRLFARIRQVVRDERTLVCLLIDEVESITAARQSASTGADPSDALRVVNAVLTQIDSLRHNRNVLLMATSNLTKCIDAAFLDRADIKMHVGYPSWRAVYTILFTAIQELMLRGIIAPVEPVLELLALDNVDNPSAPGVLSSVRLRDAAKAAQGISGRTLKKLPLLAHAFYSNGTVTMTLQAFITALHNVAEDQHRTAVETE